MSRRSKHKAKQITLTLAALFIAAGFVPTCDFFNGDDFRFVFMTDIHVQPELRATEGFEAAIDRVNELDPDFVITGGDLIMDALEVGYTRADSLYHLYTETCQRFQMPVYDVIGNHEIFGFYPVSGVESSHPEYGKQMYRNRLGDGRTYRSFDHKGWHFILLDGIGMTPEGRYTGEVDEEQLAWLKEDLENTGKHRPIVLVAHIPLVTVGPQLFYGPMAKPKPGLIIGNADKVMLACEPYNLRLVLQGHLHIVEEIEIRGIRFITGGAVSGSWWKGPNAGFEEGFVVIDVDVDKDDITWHYEDYGWEAAEERTREDD